MLGEGEGGSPRSVSERFHFLEVPFVLDIKEKLEVCFTEKKIPIYWNEECCGSGMKAKRGPTQLHTLERQEGNGKIQKSINDIIVVKLKNPFVSC